MKAYIIATNESKQIVAKITHRLKETCIISSGQDSIAVGDNFEQVLKERINAADIILIVVDEHFAKNTSVKIEMQTALSVCSHNNQSVIFPIILDDNPIPKELGAIMCARCRSDSVTDIQWLTDQFHKLIENKIKNLSVASEIPQKTRSKIFDNYSVVVSFMTVIMTILVSVITIFFDKTTHSTIFGEEFTITLITALIAITTTMVITTYTITMKRKRFVEEKEEVEQYSKKLKETITPKESAINIDGKNIEIHYHQVNTETGEQDNQDPKLNTPEIDALGRMLINLEDIKEFYTWSQKQAKGSFSLAVAMCISGFVMMAVAILLPIVFGLNIEMAIIPAIGGAIAELVAGTALFVYKNSLAQLNHYHKALHEDERFLSSVNLLSRFSTSEKQDEMLQEIIRSEIQMNLFSLSANKDCVEPQKTKE